MKRGPLDRRRCGACILVLVLMAAAFLVLNAQEVVQHYNANLPPPLGLWV